MSRTLIAIAGAAAAASIFAAVPAPAHATGAEGPVFYTEPHEDAIARDCVAVADGEGADTGGSGDFTVRTGSALPYKWEHDNGSFACYVSADGYGILFTR